MNDQPTSNSRLELEFTFWSITLWNQMLRVNRGFTLSSHLYSCTITNFSKILLHCHMHWRSPSLTKPVSKTKTATRRQSWWNNHYTSRISWSKWYFATTASLHCIFLIILKVNLSYGDTSLTDEFDNKPSISLVEPLQNLSRSDQN